jgi:importin subunit beta-1
MFTSSYDSLVAGLATIAADETIQNAAARTLACIQLKNVTSHKNAILNAQFSAKWAGLNNEARAIVHAQLLRALMSRERTIRMNAAQALNSVANIELPLNQWPDLMVTLLSALQYESAEVSLQEACLISLGYMAESIKPQTVLEAQSQHILAALCKGMLSPSTDIRLAALGALTHALVFVRRHFAVDAERSHIYACLYDCCGHSSREVRTKGFDVLASTIQLYYDFLTDADVARLWQLSAAVLGAPDLPADATDAQTTIEVWSVIAEIEAEASFAAQAEQQEKQQQSSQSSHQSSSQAASSSSVVYLRILERAASALFQMLLSCMTKQPSVQSEDEWNVSTSAATCLTLCIQALGSAVLAAEIPLVGFIQNHLASSEWRFREAALMAFGALLQGLGSNPAAVSFASQALPLVLQHMRDATPLVRDSAAWVVVNVCELFCSEVVLATSEAFMAVLQAVLQSMLQDPPRIANHAATALGFLVMGLMDGKEAHVQERRNFFFQQNGHVALLQQLCTALDRPDVAEEELEIELTEVILSLSLRCEAASAPQFDVRWVAQSIYQRLQRAMSQHDYEQAVQLAATLVELTVKQSQDSFVIEQFDVLVGTLQGLLGAALEKTGFECFTAVEELLPRAAEISQLQSRVSNLAAPILGAIGNALQPKNTTHPDLVKAACGLLSTVLLQGHFGDVSAWLAEPTLSAVVNLVLQLASASDMQVSARAACCALLGDIASSVEATFMPHALNALTVFALVAKTFEMGPGNAGQYEDDDERMAALGSMVPAYTALLTGAKGTPMANVLVTNGVGTSVAQMLADFGSHSIGFVEDQSGTVYVEASGLLGDLLAMGAYQQLVPYEQPLQHIQQRLRTYAEMDESEVDDPDLHADAVKAIQWLQKSRSRA